MRLGGLVSKKDGGFSFPQITLSLMDLTMASLPFFFNSFISQSRLPPSPHGWSKGMTVRQCPASPSGRVIILSSAKSQPPIARQTCHTCRGKRRKRKKGKMGIKLIRNQSTALWQTQAANKRLSFCTETKGRWACVKLGYHFEFYCQPRFY